MAQPDQPHAAGRRPALAGLMVGLLLLLGLAAANEQFHARLHANDSVKHGPCSVCALAQGQLDTPAIFPGWALAGPTLVRFISPHVEVRPLPVEFSVATSRGPPLSVSPL